MFSKKVCTLAAAAVLVAAATAEARSIRGTLWCAQSDPDCGQDEQPGEVRLGGIEVTLCAPDGVTPLETTSTDETGAYAFTDLQTKYTANPDLGYKVFVVKVTGSPPEGKSLGSINCLNTTKGPREGGGCEVVEPTSLDTSVCGAVDITASSIVIDTSDDADFCKTLVTGIDFVYCEEEEVCVGSIGDDVWEDTNGDGIRDPGEPPLAGVTIILCDESGEVASTTTDDAGKYLFTDVPCGCYTVKLDESTVTDPELVRCPDDLGQNRSNPASSCIGTDDSPATEDLTVDFCYHREPPPPPGGEGCTPGYWKQPHHFDSWVGYAPEDNYDGVFGVSLFGDMSLLEVLQQGGGKEKAFGRHSVAALLNASSSVEYGIPTTAEVMAFVQATVESGDYNNQKDILADLNEAGCPLN